jgi:hypothetical protein
LDIDKKSEELKPILEELERFRSEVRQVMSKQSKISKERLAHIFKKFEVFIKTF